VTGAGERRALALSALGLAAVAVLWVGGWAIRESTDVDPSALAVLSKCLRGSGLEVATPANDPLAGSASGGSLVTTIEGNSVTVSLWDDASSAERTVATYARLTSEDLTGRALVRGDAAVLWTTPPTGEQASSLYRCTG
jgi:hypothetical protein